MRTCKTAVVASLLLLLAGATSLWAQEPASWQEISRVRPGQSRVVPALWAGMPRLDAKSKVGVQSDGRAAIIKLDDLKPSGSRVAALRCRTDDAIRFQKSCRWVLTYQNDPGAARALSATAVPYRHCVYYCGGVRGEAFGSQLR